MIRDICETTIIATIVGMVTVLIALVFATAVGCVDPEPVPAAAHDSEVGPLATCVAAPAPDEDQLTENACWDVCTDVNGTVDDPIGEACMLSCTNRMLEAWRAFAVVVQVRGLVCP